MRVVNRTGHVVATIALFGFLLNPPRLCAQQDGTLSRTDVLAASGPLVTDVALQPGSVLRGRVIHAAGQAMPRQTVEVFRDGQLVATVGTGLEGQFAVGPLRGGVYRVTAADVSGVVRLWAPNTAPPGAKPQLWIVSGPVSRAQMHPAATVMGSPFVITGLVAAAVAVPVAMTNHGGVRDKPSGS
jgi:hypothetical protein